MRRHRPWQRKSWVGRTEEAMPSLLYHHIVRAVFMAKHHINTR